MTTIIKRKVVKTPNLRLLRVTDFIESSQYPIDIVWKILISLEYSRLMVITRPFQVYSWDFSPYYNLKWRVIYDCDSIVHWEITFSQNVRDTMYILDDVSSRKYSDILSIYEQDNIPFIEDLYWLKYNINYDLLPNLYKECAESLLKRNVPSSTTSTSQRFGGLTVSEYYEMMGLWQNDTPQPLRTSQFVVSDEGVETFEPSNFWIQMDNGNWTVTSAGETSTNPF